MNEFLRGMPASLDVVIPVYNEAGAVLSFHEQLSAVAAGFEQTVVRFLFVDDGSTDGTAAILEHLSQADPRVRLIQFSRNFGHQAAITAGIDCANAECVITMDGDGQHPPEKIPEMLSQFAMGYDVVLMQQAGARDERLFKRITSRAFYRILQFLSDTPMIPGVADFRLLSGDVVAQLRQMREYHRYLRGMISWLGYRTVILPYSVSRRIAGASKYSLKKMVRLSLDGIFSFSLIPLYLGITLGGFFLLAALLEAVYVLGIWSGWIQGQLAPGWSSLMFMLLVVGGVMMIMIGVVGVYIGYIFQEVKNRPLYVIRKPGDPSE